MTFLQLSFETFGNILPSLFGKENDVLAGRSDRTHVRGETGRYEASGTQPATHLTDLPPARLPQLGAGVGGPVLVQLVPVEHPQVQPQPHQAPVCRHLGVLGSQL